MAKAAAINMNDTFSPPPPTHVITPPTTYGDYLPSLSTPAGPGPGSSASQRPSGQVRALSAGKDRPTSTSSYSSKRPSGTPFSSGPSPLGSDAFPPGGPANARLPPLMHGYATNSLSRSNTPGNAPQQTGDSSSKQPQSQIQVDNKQLQQLFPERERPAHGQHADSGKEAIQPVIQHPAMLPGPTPASHPYQPKRKPPSAFMRNNPMIQQLEQSTGGGGPPRSVSTSSSRSRGPYDGQSYGALLPNETQAQQFAEEVMAAAEAAVAQGRLQEAAWGVEEMGGHAGYGTSGGGMYMSAPPWGVSSVSDLEALDSILDQLVVVDARMRKALLQGPLISFETVVPEHIMHAAAAAAAGGRHQRLPDDERDRTFLTAVKGVAEEGAGDGDEQGDDGGGGGGGALAAAGSPPPPSPATMEASNLGGAFTAATAHQAIRASAATTAEDFMMDSRDTSLFPSAIPNPGMHPTFTRAYLASKMAAKPQHLPPPPPATAEHLLRSRPPPFIAAPTYDQLCSQIRDVQRQYTCGSSRPTGQPAAAAAASGAGAGAASSGAAAAVSLPSAAATNQYIAGLDGPSLDEVVAHQELPISLERVRPTFVALKQKARRSASPRRSPMRGHGLGAGGGEGQGGEGTTVQGRPL